MRPRAVRPPVATPERPAAPASVSATVRVRYAETDRMGVVYYANYLVWFEVARCELLRARGWNYRDLEADGLILPVIAAECRYAKPAHYDDELSIEATAAILSPVRVAFGYRVLRGADGATVATGRTEHAVVDRAGRPTRLPDAIREALS